MPERAEILSHSGVVLGTVLEEAPRRELGLDDGLVPEDHGAGGPDLRARGVVERHHAVDHAVPSAEQTAHGERCPKLSAMTTYMTGWQHTMNEMILPQVGYVNRLGQARGPRRVDIAQRVVQPNGVCHRLGFERRARSLELLIQVLGRSQCGLD